MFLSNVVKKSFRSLVFANADSTIVLVLSGGHDTGSRGVLVGIEHPASIATVVALIAVDKLLLREGLHLAILGQAVVDGIEGLESADGGKSPARSAGSLALPGGNHALLGPVDGLRKGDGDLFFKGREDLGGVGHLEAGMAGNELFFCEVGEVVDAVLDMALSIDFINLPEVGSEDVVAFKELFLRGVGLLELGDELKEAEMF